MRLLRHSKDAPGWNAMEQAILSALKYALADSQVSNADLAFALATFIQGSMETSPRQILWSLTTAIQNSGFMTRGHEVLDKVVGRERLPSFSDRDSCFAGCPPPQVELRAVLIVRTNLRV